MECLRDYIGVKSCAITTIPEGGYINNLPGVELQNIDQIANTEQVTYMGVWNEVQERALKRFKTDVIAEFGKRYRLMQVQQVVNLGRKIDVNSITPATGQWRGGTIELNYETDKFVNSVLQDIFIQELPLWLPVSVNTTVKVFDLDLGIELFTTALAGVAGWNVVNVNKHFDARRIFFCYDATLINSVKFDTHDFFLDNFSYWDNFYYYNIWDAFRSSSRMKGATSPLTANVTSVTSTDNTFGLSCIWSLRCSYNNVVCSNKEYFRGAWSFCLGSELMTERINSSRINRWTTVDKAKAVELRKYFEVKYKGGVYDETEYVGELTNAVCGIDLNKYDSCIQCDAPIRYMDSLL
jgi:hypothetical protein